MLTLNLLSRDLKKQTELNRIYKLVKKISNILLVTAFMVVIMLVTAKYILQYYYKQVTDYNILVAENDQNYNIKANKINSQLNVVTNIQKNFIGWSYLIKDLINETPTGITFSNIAMAKDRGTIKITGRADSRDNLLTFEQNLKDSKIYSNINLPIKNILQKENINFEIKANLNLDELPK